MTAKANLVNRNVKVILITIEISKMRQQQHFLAVLCMVIIHWEY